MAIADKMVILVGLWRSIIKAKRSRHRWLIDCDRVVDLYYLFKQLIHFVHWKGPQTSHVFLIITQDALLAWVTLNCGQFLFNRLGALFGSGGFKIGNAGAY